MLSLADLEAHDPHAPRGRTERRFACPQCDKPKDAAHRSLAANLQTGLFTCYRCGLAGKLSDYWVDRPKLSRRELDRALVTKAFSPPPKVDKQADPERIEAARAFWDTQAQTIEENSPAARYAQGRGISWATLNDSGVRWAKDFYGRPAVLFPLYDEAGKLVAIHGRYTDDRQAPKARTMGAKASGVFLTADALKASAVVITEGPFDALSLAECGLPAIALMGRDWPQWLPRLLAFKSVLIALDADTPGDEASEALKLKLLALGAHTFRLRPNVKDWNEALLRYGVDALRGSLRVFSPLPDPTGLTFEDDGLDTRINDICQLAKRRPEAARFAVRLLPLEWQAGTLRYIEERRQP